MTVLNKHRDTIPTDAIYIGRGSKWGNPYSHLDGSQAAFKVNSRQEAVDAYSKYIADQCSNGNMSVDELADLHGKDLVCYCAPLSCHGYVLEKWAEQAHSFLNRLTNPEE